MTPLRAATRILAAYVVRHKLPRDALAPLLVAIAEALGETSKETAAPRPPRLLSPQDIASSIGEREILCFEDGKRYRVLSRALRRFGLTPHAYRTKWGLPPTYPMVAPLTSQSLSHHGKRKGSRDEPSPDRSVQSP